MISDNTIQAVRNLDINDVLSRYITIKKNSACCPFHNENTPSFHTKPTKGFFKCFGCGVSGDAIRFVEMHQKLTFYETIERIAADHGIAIELDDKYSPEERKQRQDKLLTYRQVLQFANDFFRKQLQRSPEAMNYLLKRDVSETTIDEWQLGYAPDGWHNLTQPIIERGWYEPARELGLIATSDGRNFDVYRNRIIIPITDKHSQVVGFAGRSMGDEKPKYINPRESDMYIKSAIWFGWAQAINSIDKLSEAIITEGYFDVISMHRSGATNTIASCGTSIDDKQWKALKSYAKNIAIMYDGDNAGQKKIHTHVLEGLKLGFNMKVIHVFEGVDPDDIARQFYSESDSNPMPNE